MTQRCTDCDGDVTDEYYMVWPEVWSAAVRWGEFVHFLCVSCLEQRLGRDLVPEDFWTDNPANRREWRKTARLLDRMG